MERDSIKGVIFDLDGTLIDSYQAIYIAFSYAYEGMGLRAPGFDDIKRVIGHGLGNTFRDFLGEERAPEAMKLFREKYEEVYRQHTYLLPGAAEVLQVLSGRGIKMAVATNKLGRFARDIFRYYQMDQIFSAIVGDGDVSRTKPDPEMLFQALKAMGLSREEAILVGDSLIDVETGRNAGVRVFAVSTGVQAREDLEKARPHVILDRLLDLPNYL